MLQTNYINDPIKRTAFARANTNQSLLALLADQPAWLDLLSNQLDAYGWIIDGDNVYDHIDEPLQPQILKQIIANLIPIVD